MRAVVAMALAAGVLWWAHRGSGLYKLDGQTHVKASRFYLYMWRLNESRKDRQRRRGKTC